MREHAEKRTGRSRRSSDQQTAAALEQHRSRLRTILEWTDTGVSTTDADGRVVQSNPALRAMLGYNEEELQGMSFIDFTHPDDAGTERALFAELMAGTRDQYHLEKRYIRKGGEILWGRLTVALVDATAGERRLMVAMVEDMTQQMRRIIAISDAFDAMTTDRPYRLGMPRTAALDLLLQGAGRQWDNDLVERFVLMERQSLGGREHETSISA